MRCAARRTASPAKWPTLPTSPEAVGTVQQAPPTSAPPARDIIRIVVAASVGNALEWYDFIVFGYFAPQIAAIFFPTADPATGLLLTFGTYGVSFLARPFGAAVLGGYADRRGRRGSLTLSILLMTLGTLMMAAMPGYGTIGRLAPIGILAARLLQGFSAGGEFGSATAFMIEHAGLRAGWFGSFQFSSQAIAAILGSGTAWGLSAALGQSAMNDWGFRVPFLLGLIVGPVGLYVRSQLDETPAFRSASPAAAPILTVLRQNMLRVALGAAVIAGGTAGTYLNIYLPTYASKHLHMASARSYAVTFLVSIPPLIVTPLAAHLSDRRGRLPIMILLVALLLGASYPAFLLVVAYPTPVVLAAVLIVLNILRSGYSAPIPALLAEMFPVRVRAVGMSLAYTAGVVLFGGFAQLVMEWLIDRTGNQTVPGLYLAAGSLLTLGALLIIRARIRLHL
jgi:MHS family proline/betaine transporter-like MFS transporter